jgi:hypothetical protein
VSNRRKLPAADDAAMKAQMQAMADDAQQWYGFLPHVRPVAVTTRVRVNDASVGGRMVPHVELTVVTPTGPVVVFLPAEVAEQLGEHLKQAGLGVRTGLEPFAAQSRLELPPNVN